MFDGVNTLDLWSGAGRALLRILAPLVLLAAGPAFGQAWPNDLRASQFIDATYRVDPAWRLNLYAELREDHNISRIDNSIFRPNVQYEFAPHWRAAVGYVQFQGWQPPFVADYGPFQDLYYQNKFGGLGVLGRWRVNETFAKNNPALWVVTSLFGAVSYPIADSDWFLSISEEIFFSVKAEYTGHKTGFQENKAFFGVGYPLGSHVVLTGGYELDAINIVTPQTTHNLRLGLIANF
jgi:hypothetical protein